MKIRKIGSLVFGLLQVIVAGILIFWAVTSYFNILNVVSMATSQNTGFLQIVILLGSGSLLLLNGLLLTYEWSK